MRKVTGQPRVHLWRAVIVFQSKAKEVPSNPDDERDGIFRLPNKEGRELWEESLERLSLRHGKLQSATP